MTEKTERTRFRRSPFLVMYWDQGQLHAENYFRCLRIGVSGGILRILDAMNKWLSFDELNEAIPSRSRAFLQYAVTKLHVAGIVISEADQGLGELEAWDHWNAWAHSASFLHFATRNVDYQLGDLGYFRRLLNEEPQPPLYKEFERAHAITLPQPQGLSDALLVDTLLRRETCRSFDRRGISLQALSDILFYTWGQTGWKEAGMLGKLLKKTSASSGARHPVEAYVLVQNVAQVEPGLYHYSVKDHALVCLSEGSYTEAVIEGFPTQPWVVDAPVIFIMTALFERVRWKYRFPRAYRTLLMDVGHLGQTFHLVVTALGFSPFTSAAIKEEVFESLLELDPVLEGVMYGAAAGYRLEGSTDQVGDF